MKYLPGGSHFTTPWIPSSPNYDKAPINELAYMPKHYLKLRLEALNNSVEMNMFGYCYKTKKEGPDIILSASNRVVIKVPSFIASINAFSFSICSIIDALISGDSLSHACWVISLISWRQLHATL